MAFKGFVYNELRGKVKAHKNRKRLKTVGLVSRRDGGKVFHTGESTFPRRALSVAMIVPQRAEKLKGGQLITLFVGNPYGTGGNCPDVFRCVGHQNRRRSRDFQRNPRRQRQRTTHRHQRTACGNIKRSGEFERVFSFCVLTADKYRNGQGQTGPLAGVRFHSTIASTEILCLAHLPLHPHPGGQTQNYPVISGIQPCYLGVYGLKPGAKEAPTDDNPSKPRDFTGSAVRLSLSFSFHANRKESPTCFQLTKRKTMPYLG